MKNRISRHVIVVGVDGLRPDMINEQTMPNLTALRTQGVSSQDHRSVFPSETRGALTALASGARPETTGVLGNEFYSRDGSTRLTCTDTIHDWHAGEKRLVGGMVTTPSLSETLAKNGLSLAVVTSSGQGSFTALNWKGSALQQTGYNVRHPALGFPAELALEIGDRHSIPPEGHDRGAERQAVDVFITSVWPAKKPAASIIWLTEVDSASHRYGLGGQGMLDSMRDCDTAIGDLLDWRERQPDRDDIVIFVTSDHGHSTVSSFISVGETLAEAKIPAAQHLGDDVNVLYRPGRAPGFWLRDFDQNLLQDVFDALLDQSWYGAAFTRAREPGSSEGIIKGTLALELTGAAHPRAPDLYVNLKGNADRNAHGIIGTSSCDAAHFDKTPIGGGTHGGLHEAELAAVLIGDGSGLKSGGTVVASRTAIYDLAPTILYLLGIPSPSSMTGRALKEFMEVESKTSPVVVSTYTSSIAGKTSRIVIGNVGMHPYIDKADVLIDDEPENAPIQRSDLVVNT